MNMSLHDALFGEVRADMKDVVMQAIIEEAEAPVPELANYGFPIELELGQCWDDANVQLIHKGK